MLKTRQFYLRKAHRYLGLFIGIQFLGWTISGLYFSWNHLDDVHGDHLRKQPKSIPVTAALVSPEQSIRELKKTATIDSIHSVHLISVLGKPTYQIEYFSGHAGEVHRHTHFALADAETGQLRESLSKDEAQKLAADYVVAGAIVKEASLLEAYDGHHEYRDRPLPAYAVTFEKPSCTVYVSAEKATFETIRHDQWRTFDWLWMLHTMDYKSRDNINNWALRIFSIFGLITVVSGFVLFFVSSPTLKKISK